MKSTLLLKITIFLLLMIVSIGYSHAAIEGLNDSTTINLIEKASIMGIDNSGTISDNVKKTGFNILTTIKYIFSGVLLIFIVYIGVQMVLSMGTNEDDLTKAKKQILYILVGLIFINIPGTIYESFNSNKIDIDGSIAGTFSFVNAQANQNIFINTDMFNLVLNGGIVGFIKYLVFSIAIFMIIIAAYQIIMSKGKSEDVSEAKNKIGWSLAGLIFLGFIEAWQKFIFSGNIEPGKNIFETASNMVLYFAGPVTIFFLTLAGYYLITAGGDEEKIKKAKTIIINVLIAVVLLLSSYIFLADLMTLNI